MNHNPQSDRRFYAACAAMSGLIPTLERQYIGDGEYGGYYIGVRPTEEVASEALIYADALLKALDASEPKAKCEHFKEWVYRDQCTHCGEKLDK